MSLCSLTAAAQDEAERRARQAELDAVCESARQRAIRIVKAEYVKECIEKEMRPDRAACERFYVNYGERTGSRQPLFYDLEECVAATEFRTSMRAPE